MSRRLGVSIALVALTSTTLFVSAVLLFPINHKDVPGVAFWIALTMIASSLAVRMPGGNVLDVGFAPMVAAMSVGNPAVAGWTALLGSTQSRELRRRVPWYGVLANHAGITGPAVVCTYVLGRVPNRSNAFVDFAATVGVACIFFALNTLITAALVSVRDNGPVLKEIRADRGAYVNMLALAPIAWLMAQVYVAVGPWAVLLFALPLYTTRVAYARLVEVREMFTETVRSLAEAVDKRDTFTSGHSHRVQAIALDIGRAMKVSDDELEALRVGWPAPRHRQDRRPGCGPAQAGSTDPR